MEIDKIQRVASILLKNRQKIKGFWPWLGESIGKPIDKKRANKFLLGCILDYQINADIAWGNARRLAEDILADPDDLWQTITSVSKHEWMSKRKQYSLHRFPKAHERVWRIGKEIITRYDGDVRKIWMNKPLATVLERLNEIKVGEQISRMIVGALIDTKQIVGTGNVKVDRHVKRVIGRVIIGSQLSEQKTLEITQKMFPENPWLLDQPLYLIGKTFCFVSNPRCSKCYLKEECTFCK